jgi:hypothetical protein
MSCAPAPCPQETVRYRIHKAAGLRGRGIDEDRLDLEPARWAAAWLGSAALSG